MDEWTPHRLKAALQTGEPLASTPPAAVRATFSTLRRQPQQATIKTNREREEVQPVRTEALPVCRDFAETTEFFYRKDLDDASRRQKCEQWGVNYIFEPNEPGAPAVGGSGTTGGTTPPPNQ